MWSHKRKSKEHDDDVLNICKVSNENIKMTPFAFCAHVAYYCSTFVFDLSNVIAVWMNKHLLIVIIQCSRTTSSSLPYFAHFEQYFEFRGKL